MVEAEATPPLLLDVGRVDAALVVKLTPQARLAAACSVSAGFLAILRTLDAPSLQQFCELFEAEGLNSSRGTKMIDRIAQLAHLIAASYLPELKLGDALHEVSYHHRGGKGATQACLAAVIFRRAARELASMHVEASEMSALLDIHFAPGTALANHLCKVRACPVRGSPSVIEVQSSSVSGALRVVGGCALAHAHAHAHVQTRTISHRTRVQTCICLQVRPPPSHTSVRCIRSCIHIRTCLQARPPPSLSSLRCTPSCTHIHACVCLQVRPPPSLSSLCCTPSCIHIHLQVCGVDDISELRVPAEAAVVAHVRDMLDSLLARGREERKEREEREACEELEAMGAPQGELRGQLGTLFMRVSAQVRCMRMYHLSARRPPRASV